MLFYSVAALQIVVIVVLLLVIHNLSLTKMVALSLQKVIKKLS